VLRRQRAGEVVVYSLADLKEAKPLDIFFALAICGGAPKEDRFFSKSSG
jgi:hypothetical protein